MKNKYKLGAGAGLLITALGTLAWAATPAQTIEARQNNFKQMGRAMKGIGDELKKSAPDLRVVRSNAGALAQAAARVPSGFPPGSGPDTGLKTKALPAIWQQNATFRDLATRMINASANLRRAAAGGNLDQIRTAVGALGETCKNCHDRFKAK